MKARYLPVLLALATASSAAFAQGQTETPAAPPQPDSSAAPTADPAPAAAAPTTTAPETEPFGTATGPAGGATVTIGGDTTAPASDKPSEASATEKKETKLPFRGSTFLFDQSMSTQTAHLEWSPQQSYIPLYEWWFSFRPRWYFNEHVYVWARFDLTKELTNSQDTTLYREDVFGDIWTDLRYTSPIEAIHKDFKATAGVRALWPTSKESQGNGIYVTTGLTTSASQKITINGESAKFLNDAEFILGVNYSHPFSRATTPTNPNLNYVRQNTEGRSFGSDQLRGTPLSNHTLLASIHGGLSVTPKLSASLDMIWINSWKYPAPGNVTVPVSGGSVDVPRSGDDHLFNQRTWFIASADYSLTDEVSLGLGYYNLANELNPSSQRRSIFGDNVWWSPDARVFFDVTVNLDKVYEWANGSKAKNAAAATAQERTLQRVQKF